MPYFIRKRSRASQIPYCGPSCELAGVPIGTWYETEADALTDAAKLDRVNAVGWVVEYKEESIIIGEHNTRTAAESQEMLKGPIGQLLGVDHLFEQEEG